MTKFILREPFYPVLIQTDSHIKAACNYEELLEITAKYPFSDRDKYIVIDATAEGWVYQPEKDRISPMVFGNDKNWTKKRIIDLYNGARSESGQTLYRCGSLSNKRVGEIIGEISSFEGRP